MKYVLVKPEALYKCNALIKASGYYAPVRLEELGGIVVAGYTDDGENPVSCVWFGITGNRAYLDYLVADPAYPGIGVRTLIRGHALLEAMGVREVNFAVHRDNRVARRIAHIFNATEDMPYSMHTVQIGASHGEEDD